MAISLSTITFDRTSSGKDAAWSVPSDSGSTGVSLDWQRSGWKVSSNAVAYSLARLATLSDGATITVTAQTTQPLTKIYLRARPIAGILESTSALVTTGTGTFRFEVSLPTADWVASGTHEWHERWRWEQSPDGQNWTTFDETSHTLFVIPNDPAISWNLNSQRPAQQPWQAVLSLACGWADGANSVDDAAARITERVYALGGMSVLRNGKPETIEYHTGGVEYNLAHQFHLGYFLPLARLDNNPGPAKFNCVDGAGAVVVLSNALGCRLNMVRLCPSEGRRFLTTAVLRAGGTTAQAETFEVHAVAVSGGADLCWDPCLKVNLDGVAPLDLVTGFPLHSGNAGYRVRLASGAVPNVLGPQTILVAETGDEPTDLAVCPGVKKRLRNILAGTQWSEPSDEAIEAIRTALHAAAVWSRSGTLTIRERSYKKFSGVLKVDSGRAVTADIWQSPSLSDATALALDIATTSSAGVNQIDGYADRVLGNDEIGEYLLIWGRLVMRIRHPEGREGLRQVLMTIASNLLR